MHQTARAATVICRENTEFMAIEKKVWYGMVWYGMVWYHIAWYGMICKAWYGA